ncbi:endonuclease [bacterium]|nr:endonuclease [candidate division CSSED10-310 bacterium]
MRFRTWRITEWGMALALLTAAPAAAWDCTPPDAYYEGTEGLTGQILLEALREIIDDHVSLGYNTARDVMYGVIDCRNGEEICCVYTGRCGSEPNACSRAGAVANNFSCEHTWPQSFFDEDEPLRSDIFNLYPSDMTANNVRDRYPFGTVTGAPGWQVGGSKLGTDGERTVFEPRDEHKGNAARSILYMLARYPLTQLQSQGTYLDDRQLDVLLEWNHLDPPDEEECMRNDGIYSYQHNRNPFIDDSWFADRIWLAMVTPMPTWVITPTEVPVTTTPLPPLTPTIAPTPNGPTVNLEMPAHFFYAGSPCQLDACLVNPGPPVNQAMFTVALNIGTAEYWFWPRWVLYPPEVDYISMDLSTGTMQVPIIEPFPWPATGTAMQDLVFIGVLVTPDGSALLGTPGTWTFGYDS